ncbi:MAG: alpha-L-fucosidase [Treponema sp.]|nr:alpha-L-fucosidase [Treponema sp.]
MENKSGSAAALDERAERAKWFCEARFGMFIHWGLYAIPARGEWVRGAERMERDEYMRYFDEFAAERCDPREWAALAKRAGMKYAVLTAKHHDGFCLWDTALSDFKSTLAPARRDFVAEFLEAFRAEGIRVGLYFSLIDWHHPDFPHFGDRHHPRRDDPAEGNEARDFERYLRFMHGQIRELLTGYGRLDLMWFDFSYDDMSGEKWKAGEIMRMARELQPGMLVDNRLEASGDTHGAILKADPPESAGDFACPEQIVPPEGLRNELGQAVPWEACITLNNNWGYHSGDRHWKDSSLVIRMLAECVSKNGNLLLNVGPNARGKIPAESARILGEVGRWMDGNGAAIYGCGSSGLEKPEWGRFTRRGRLLYAHVHEARAGGICLAGMAGRIEKMRLLRDGSELLPGRHWNLKPYPEHAFFFLNADTLDNYPLPDPAGSVVEITLRE